MNRPRLTPALVITAVLLAACLPTPEQNQRTAKSTLVIGIDVSGSFRQHYDDAISFAAHYLYGHLNGMGDLRVPTAVFVGSVGGGRPGEAKSFQPVHLFEDKSVEEIEEVLRGLYPPEDSFTDFNSFFDRVATLVKRQGLILAPINIVMLSDGVPDVSRANGNPDERFAQIDATTAELVKLRLFAGLTNDEAAAVKNLPPSTAKKHWMYARSWLRRELAVDDDALVLSGVYLAEILGFRGPHPLSTSH